MKKLSIPYSNNPPYNKQNDRQTYQRLRHRQHRPVPQVQFLFHGIRHPNRIHPNGIPIHHLVPPPVTIENPVSVCGNGIPILNHIDGIPLINRIPGHQCVVLFHDNLMAFRYGNVLRPARCQHPKQNQPKQEHHPEFLLLRHITSI